MHWTEIDFVLEEESPSRPSRPFLDGWETIRFVMSDDEEEQESPHAESGSV